MTITFRRLVEHYEGWRYRRTYGRNADHSRAMAASEELRRGTSSQQMQRNDAAAE